jgi:aerobic-type carbon monoxide dehydrogenase small subunit (CoxS/CutS family)
MTGDQIMGEKRKNHENTPKFTRRTFIKSIGISSVGVAAVKGEGMVGQLQKAGILQRDTIVGPGKIKITLQVNGKNVNTQIEPRTMLAEAIRDHLHLTGTKIGCNRGSCGACTVILEGKAVPSCMTLALDAIGKPIETIEGLEESKDKLHPLQEAFIEHDALQCGFCTSGMIMSAKHLLDKTKSPTTEEIKEAVSGNLCRRGTYPHVFNAVETAAKKIK